MAGNMSKRFACLPLLLFVFISCALSSAIPAASPITEVRTDIVTVSQHTPSLARRWANRFTNIFKSRQAPSCGTGLLSCDVEDPTRLEAPWHGVSAPFPQCYDPTKYVCSSNFLCPVGAPKIDGQYACGPYSAQTAISQTPISQTPITTLTPTQSASTGTGCGVGTLLCEVQDPTRLEAPWHGVSAPFPQCYDPAAYVCSENFLCPINAPKIHGQYACGPYIASTSTQVSSESGSSSVSQVSETTPIGTSTSISSSTSPKSETSQTETLISKLSSESVSSASSSFTSIFSSTTSASNLPISDSTLSSRISASSLSSSRNSLSSSNSLPGSISSQNPTSQSTGSSHQSSQSSASSSPTSLAETSREIVIGSSTYFLGTGLSTVTDNGNTIVLGGSNGVSIVSQTLSLPTSGDGVITTDGITISVHNPTGVQTSLTNSPSSIGSSGTSISQTGVSSPLSSSISSSVPGGSQSSVTSQSSPSSGVSSAQTSLPGSTDTSTTPGSGVSSAQTSLPSSTDTSTAPGSGISSTQISSPSSIDTSTTSPGSGDSSTQTSSPSSTITSTPPEVVIRGSTYTFPLSSTTLIEPDGQSIILGPSGIVIGSDTIGFPSGTSPIAITTDGVTLTFDPASSRIVSTEPASQTSTPEGIVIGGSSFILPSSPTTLIEPNGDTVVLGPSGIVVGSDTISFPTVTTPTVITTDGLTFTLEPGGGVINTSPTPTATPSVAFIDGNPFTIGTGLQTITESNGQVLTLGPNGVIFGTDTIPFPAPCSTITTLLINLGIPCITTSSIPLSTSTPPSLSGALPIFTAWPDGAFFSTDTSGDITTGTATTGTHVYVTTTSSGSDGTGAPFVIGIPHLPCFLCGCWFCPPKIPGFNIFGGIKPGIYPPPPPGILPPGFSVNLPSITIGGNGDPTYSSEPEEPTSTDSSTSSSSSSSSCSTATATDCTAFISYGIDQSGSTTTSITSSQCTTITACSVTPFTTTSVTSSVAPSNTRVAIFPVESSSSDDQKTVQDLITKDLEDPSNLFVSSLSGVSGGTLFWKANLTLEQQNTLKQNPTVSSIIVEGSLNDIDDDNFEPSSASSHRLRRHVANRSIEEYKPSNASIPNHLLWGRDTTADVAVDQLKILSQPKDGTKLSEYTQYTYDELAGFGSTVYVIDTGASPTHDEIRTLDPGIRKDQNGVVNGWIYPGDQTQAFWDNTPGDYDLERYHGTCMTGLVSSPTYGVAKRATLVIVKTLQDKMSDQIDAFTQVHNDIIAQRALGVVRPVINFSRNIVPDAQFPVAEDDLREFHAALKKLLDDGAVIIVNAGNRGVNVPIGSYPALFALSARFGEQLDLIVVGATDDDSDVLNLGADRGSQGGDSLRIYAAAFLSVCPAKAPSSTQDRSGTSIAAALTSGLAAYFWSLPEYRSIIDTGDKAGVASRMRQLIEDMAWKRKDDAEVKIIWNGKESRVCSSPDSSPPGKDKLQGRACSLSASPSSSPIPTSSTATSIQTPLSTPSPTSSPTPFTTSTTSSTSSTASPTPTKAWSLVLNSTKCEQHNVDFSYYSLRGFEENGKDLSCISLKNGLPTFSLDSNSCSWFTHGGADPAQPCSAGTFTTPTSYLMRNGFCTLYATDDCTGDLLDGVSGIDKGVCTDYADNKFLPRPLLSMRCAHN